ncbi:tripartite tricarboxylate transporter substrate-binding protein [Salibacterium halotolerans]|uniref:Tripartite-type tricarboxylate transporter, receptor component TctC n=1 Tax=Salibacterium halotolerans TaxID=1884432 RepID=A0A1I5SNQ2_9BACI|nr:tripartite tricarboxylate transporter substrate-binding protein [Salibacterium halotolerans]SFP72339.1 Tripartite-type tricarboxylate transporter, receptor component TctC [Salibacterium halotolerans]
MKKTMYILMAALLGILLAACGESSGSEETAGSGETSAEKGGGSGEAALDLSRMRVVIGSTSTGGDTYQNAEAVSRYAEDILNTNMQVDAVGGVQAFDALSSASNDGSTVMFFHDMAYLGVEYGSFDQSNKLENYTIGPMVSTNPGNAFLASADAPYDSMAESAEWLSSNPNEEITVAIQAGGVSEIVFNGYYLWVQEEYGEEVSNRIKAYVTGSQQDKDQALWDDNADIIHGSIGANNQYTKDGVEDQVKMKFLGITAGERVEGFDIPTLAEQGITVGGEEFTFDKEFFFLLPKDVNENVVTALDNAVSQVVENEDYQSDLNNNAYTPNYMPSDEAEEYLLDKRETMRSIIERAPDLNNIAQ